MTIFFKNYIPAREKKKGGGLSTSVTCYGLKLPVIYYISKIAIKIVFLLVIAMRRIWREGIPKTFLVNLLPKDAHKS